VIDPVEHGAQCIRGPVTAEAVASSHR
jgi:hypothetical protein